MFSVIWCTVAPAALRATASLTGMVQDLRVQSDTSSNNINERKPLHRNNSSWHLRLEGRNERPLACGPQLSGTCGHFIPGLQACICQDVFSTVHVKLARADISCTIVKEIPGQHHAMCTL